MKPTITEADYQWAARTIGCEVAAIKAVAHVEAAGSGFLTSGEPKILFEAHVFSRYTFHQYDRSHPHISSKKWNRRLYKGGQAEHARLAEAARLNRDAALMSASWGKFQVMGFHWQALKYGSLQRFINAMYRGENEHLYSFVEYIKAYNLARYLKVRDWAAFANSYNGPSWAQNDYANKMARAYRMFS